MPIIDRVKLSKEVNISGMHYWVGLEASILEHENVLESLKLLDGKIEQFCNPVIQTYTVKSKPVYAPQEEFPTIDINDR